MVQARPDIETRTRYRHIATGHTIVIIDSDLDEDGTGTIQFKMDEFFGVHVIDVETFVNEYVRDASTHIPADDASYSIFKTVADNAPKLIVGYDRAETRLPADRARHAAQKFQTAFGHALPEKDIQAWAARYAEEEATSDGRVASRS